MCRKRLGRRHVRLRLAPKVQRATGRPGVAGATTQPADLPLQGTGEDYLMSPA